MENDTKDKATNKWVKEGARGKRGTQRETTKCEINKDRSRGWANETQGRGTYKLAKGQERQDSGSLSFV